MTLPLFVLGSIGIAALVCNRPLPQIERDARGIDRLYNHGKLPLKFYPKTGGTFHLKGNYQNRDNLWLDAETYLTKKDEDTYELKSQNFFFIPTTQLLKVVPLLDDPEPPGTIYTI